jgi:predicted sulfurtransferase
MRTFPTKARRHEGLLSTDLICFRAFVAALVLLAVSLTPVAAHAQSADAIDAPRISMADFKKLLAAKHVVVVDTRNADAFPLGHIAGALLLPLEGRLTWPDQYESVVEKLIATKQPVVTYCA